MLKEKHLKQEAVVEFNTPSSSLASYGFYQLGVNSYTMEIGSVERLNVRYEKCEFYRRLQDLLENKTMTDADSIDYFIIKKILKRTHEKYNLFINPNFKNFDCYNQNYIISEANGVQYSLEKDYYLLFPNQNVPVGGRSCLLLEKSKK